MRQAFTLVELIVAIGIVLLLAAALGVGIGQAKQQGWKAMTISNLRQLSQASSLYVDQYEKEPAAADKLAELGMLPTALLGTRLDVIPEGIGNFHRIYGASLVDLEPKTYKYSVLSFREEFGFESSELMQEWQSGQAQGLYVVPVKLEGPGTIDSRRYLSFVKSFIRASSDGSVIVRPSQAITTRNGASVCINTMWFFADFPITYRESKCQ
jgi:prepilin-type N-terminal cleavage/methylation domain-containing protein